MRWFNLLTQSHWHVLIISIEFGCALTELVIHPCLLFPHLFPSSLSYIYTLPHAPPLCFRIHCHRNFNKFKTWPTSRLRISQLWHPTPPPSPQSTQQCPSEKTPSTKSEPPHNPSAAYTPSPPELREMIFELVVVSPETIPCSVQVRNLIPPDPHIYHPQTASRFYSASSVFVAHQLSICVRLEGSLLGEF